MSVEIEPDACWTQIESRWINWMLPTASESWLAGSGWALGIRIQWARPIKPVHLLDSTVGNCANMV